MPLVDAGPDGPAWVSEINVAIERLNHVLFGHVYHVPERGGLDLLVLREQQRGQPLDAAVRERDVLLALPEPPVLEQHRNGLGL